AVPALGQGLLHAELVLRAAHGPYVVGVATLRGHRHPIEDVVAHAHVGAGDDAPRGAVPVLDQRLLHHVGGEVEAHGPDVVCGDGRDRVELAAVTGGVWAGHDGPARTVPVLGQRERPEFGAAHGPHVVR